MVDTASSQLGDLTLTLPAISPETQPDTARSATQGLSAQLVSELWLHAEAESCGLSCEELARSLAAVGAKYNHGQPQEVNPTTEQMAEFCRALRLPELALAQACSLGREAAWRRFLELYRAPLTQAAIAIAGSATVGHDLADSLYSELFGLSEREGQRRSPLASYSGRGSLLGWLRATLAQRHVDLHRRTLRETTLDTQDPAVPSDLGQVSSSEIDRLTKALSKTLASLPAGDRFLLNSYFLDQRTLLHIGRLLRVHEATVSRRLKRLTVDLRKQLIRTLQAYGLSKRAAEEALGTDPRDLELDLRKMLQTPRSDAFLNLVERSPRKPDLARPADR